MRPAAEASGNDEAAVGPDPDPNRLAVQAPGRGPVAAGGQMPEALVEAALAADADPGVAHGPPAAVDVAEDLDLGQHRPEVARDAVLRCSPNRDGRCAAAAPVVAAEAGVRRTACGRRRVLSG